MFILKPIIFLITIFVLFILGRFYMLPIYLPLDTKPKGDWTASYLAKSIASDAGCTIDFLGDGVVWEENTTEFDFSCTMPNTSVNFIIHIFLNKKLKDTFLAKKYKSSYWDRHCFKKGPYYVISGDTGAPVRKLDIPYKDKGKEPKFTNTNSPIVARPLTGEQFYQQFPGEDINITISY